MQKNIDVNTAKEHGLTALEYDKIVEILGRDPNFTELSIYAVMWSEHCSYKSTRKYLKNLPTKAPWVICGPGENAGIIDIGDGDAIVFKMESHNHPSFIEPTQGAATGVGGIIRDIFTMGARPICLLNALRFGDIDHALTPRLLSGVVKGISSYGNCIGVPTVGGECNFHPSYNGNILVNAMAVGLAKSDKIFYSSASHIGAKVIYAGAKTGRDGIHGATMASSEFNDELEAKRPTIQVGDPFTEKLLIEACMELMSHDAILAIQDMGAAGLTCSSLEMADKGGTGIELNLNQVPLREENMSAFEIMLSESQERMLMVLKEGKEELALDIFQKWDLPCAVIGEITDTGKLIIKYNDIIEADLVISPLSDNAPIYDRPYEINVEPVSDTPPQNIPDIDANDILLKLISSPNLCSKSWIYRQYDKRVMGDTIATSEADAAIIRINKTDKAIAVSTDCTPRYVYADPKQGTIQAVVECWRNITATGAKPLAITNCLNFGNPEKPEIMGQIVSAIEGIREACEYLEFPVVSGNVSLYNETNNSAIHPTPAIGGVGLIKNLDYYATIDLKEAGDIICVIGETKGHIGRSIYQEIITGQEYGKMPIVDLQAEKKNGDFVRNLIEKNIVNTCHDISDGGLYVALTEMAIASNLGIKIHKEYSNEYLFGEDQARYIIACRPDNLEVIKELAENEKIDFEEIGTVLTETVINYRGNFLSLDKLHEAHKNTIPSIFIDVD